MFLVAEEKDSRCSRFNPPLLFTSKGHGSKEHINQINNSDPGHTHLKQQFDKNLKITFASPPGKGDEKEKEKKN